ncbi:SRPBCC family protein [Streptomyces zhihengii]|uniref:SRPBCC family protein n=1 Tax=Streptomyces zhihengii TaxID=1818004 RepID=UPI00364428CD
MGDYDNTIAVHVAPERLFSYLADVRNLPAYLPRLTAAEPHGADTVTVTAHIEPPDGPEQDVTSEAWIRVVADGRSLEWGSPGDNDYHGRFQVIAGDDGNSLLTVHLHTDNADGSSVTRGLQESLHGIETAVEKAESA